MRHGGNLRRTLLDLLPDDERKLTRSRVWAAFHARAAVDPGFAETLSDMTERIRMSLRLLVEHAREQDELAPGADPGATVELLLLVIDGIWMEGARLRPVPSVDRSRAAIESVVSLVSR